MKLSPKKVLWILLLITLILSSSGIILRMTNESRNKNIITMVDYREFKKAADMADYDINQVLSRLKLAKVEYVAVKETSLTDLEYRGDIKLCSFGELKGEAGVDDPVLYAEIARLEEKEKISPAALTAVTGDPAVARFLDKGLSQRFAPGELVKFKSGDKHGFIINTEIQKPPKTATKAYPRDVLVGFEKDVLDQLKEAGFKIVLVPGNSTGSRISYIKEYEKLIDEYGVKYILFNGEVSGSPDKLKIIEEIIEKKGITVAIIETSSQLGFLPQNGLDKVIRDTGYPVNRLYSSRNDEYLKDINERYYRWVRAVVDRGIRFLFVVPFEDDKLTYSENIDNTIRVIGEFHQTMAEKGFILGEPLNRLSPKMPGEFHYFMVSLSILWVAMLYLAYLCRPKKIFWWLMAGIGILVLFGINIVLKADFSKLYALAAAIIYPSFSSLLLLLYLKKSRNQNLPLQFTVSLAIILGVNALGMYTVGTSLSDIRYIMNIEYFRGVKLAFVFPLIMFIVNYVAVFKGEKSAVEYVLQFLREEPNYLILFFLGLAFIGIYYYVARSGHTGEVKVSSLEIRIREILETIFLARPRFKEIIIGYPSLMLMIYLYQKYKKDWLLFIFGLGTVIGSISMVNSFCHVFTAVTISANRTLNGLLVGVIIGFIALAGVIIIEKIYRVTVRKSIPYIPE
ncbi:DUF5693 family protein [Thermosyntropha sp.]|uniref:DUF5693 family protein n=1 Tax=Thermosyntropha sp. TaxID=2740820 RepID=UPI0025E27C19|nr:DUF5693 family protein [Thermosyntropha sp.]MBO8159731.1 hypothetical protein [Thermosyntropha sp.]